MNYSGTSLELHLLVNETSHWNLIRLVRICLRDQLKQILWTDYSKVAYIEMVFLPGHCVQTNIMFTGKGGSIQKYLLFFSVQINNMYIFLSWREVERVKIALKWDSCCSLPCSWNHDSHYITKMKIKWNKQQKWMGLISRKMLSIQVFCGKVQSFCCTDNTWLFLSLSSEEGSCHVFKTFVKYFHGNTPIHNSWITYFRNYCSQGSLWSENSDQERGMGWILIWKPPHTGICWVSE